MIDSIQKLLMNKNNFFKKTESQRSFIYRAVHGEELISAFQSTVPIGNPVGNNTWDVNGRILLFSTHNIKSQSLIGFRQVHDTRMSMSLAGGKSGYSGL